MHPTSLRFSTVLISCVVLANGLEQRQACSSQAPASQEPPADQGATAPSVKTPGQSAPSKSSTRTLDWADVIEAEVDPAVVTNAGFRDAIKATGLPWRVKDKGTNIEMLLIPPGEFVMGKSRGDQHANPNELPAHEVIISRPFFLGRYEVTQQQWTAINKSNPSEWKKFDRPTVDALMEQRIPKMVESCLQDGLTRAEAQQTVTEVLVAQGWKRDLAERATSLKAISEEQAEEFTRSWSPPLPADNVRLVEWPVTMVSWEDSDSFCTKTGLRLPTEAEWEYACRAGTRTSSYGNLRDVAWHFLDYEQGRLRSGSPCAVGTRAANGFGLFDTLGNVYEWVADNYGPYCDALQRDPIGPPSGEYKVFRGGGDWELSCRASARFEQSATYKHAIGLRVARSP